MILDNRVLFSDQQAITATAASTNSVDLKALGLTYDKVQLRRRQFNKAIPFMFNVTESFNTLTSLTVAIQTDEDVAFGSPVTVVSISIPLASLTIGYKFPYDILPKGINERYMRLLYTVVGSNPTLGKISCGVVAAEDEGYRGNA
jgi:hypothetical protein